MWGASGGKAVASGGWKWAIMRGKEGKVYSKCSYGISPIIDCVNYILKINNAMKKKGKLYSKCTYGIF